MNHSLNKVVASFLLAACLFTASTSASSNNLGGSRRLMQNLPVLAGRIAPAPAPGLSGPPCTCSVASIFSGVTYCFHLSPTPGTNGTYSQQATTSCTIFSQYYTCNGQIVNLAPGTKTDDYPNATITGQGLQCHINSWGNSPIPAPAAPPASSGAKPCIVLPASDYGPTGSIEYAMGSNGAATPDCTSGAGIVCSVTIPLNNGTAKICASQSAEDNIRG